MSRTILITGCSSGLGAELAVLAAQRGYDVFATMRDLSRREALDRLAKAAGTNLNVRTLDVQDPSSIAAVVAEVETKHGGVDVLVNNAGIGFVRSTEQAASEDIERLFDINLMGVIRCTKAVLPGMRSRRAGRVLAISSVGGLVGQPFNELYCASKFAVEGFIEALSCYVGPAFGLHFSLVEPGGIQSEFATNVLAQLDQSGGILDDEYKPILQRYMGTVQNRSGELSPYQTSAEVAQIVLNCAEDPVPPVRVRTSAWGEDLCHLKTGLDPDGMKLRAKVRNMFLDEETP